MRDCRKKNHIGKTTKETILSEFDKQMDGYLKSYPKPKRTKLSIKEYQQLRKDCCKRAWEHCELCGGWCPAKEGHIHHIKSRGAGGGDDFHWQKDHPDNNVLWVCYICHNKTHMGLKK